MTGRNNPRGCISHLNLHGGEDSFVSSGDNVFVLFLPVKTLHEAYSVQLSSAEAKEGTKCWENILNSLALFRELVICGELG